ncbi:MAG: hypothetical protein ABW036_10625 [Flavitalea sp.]
MKKLLRKLSPVLLAVLFVTACKKNDSGDHDHDHEEETVEEFRHIRLLVSDVNGTTLTQVAPVDGKITNFEARYPNATLYATGTSRFAALLYGTRNFSEFFDTGLELHDDHVDIKGTPKFAAITAEGLKPTHFKSRGTETLIFNDGDGTLSVGEESNFHTTGAKFNVLNAGLDAHHGAMAQFDNKTYAVTFVDKSSAKAGPHGVKIINASGTVVHESTLPVSRLHGNATDGTNAVFGVEGGVLVVNASGAQKLIPNPGDWGTIRLGTILEAKGVNKFVGFVATKGAYLIDIAANSIVPILENTDVMQAKVNMKGNHLNVLLHDGTLKIFDLANNTLLREKNVVPATSTTEAIKPVMEATSKYVYITSPSTGEVHQVKTEDLSAVTKFKVSAQPSKLVILGFETNESH